MHLGNARTALFNWLYARHHGGEFILRIEDTDRERHTEAAVQVIYDSLKWMGLNWDGPVLRQSERLHIYHEVAEKLIAEGKAYRCNCTREELEAKKEAMKEATNHACYDGTCREKNLGPDCGPHVIRFKMPKEGESTFEDLIQGTITKSYKDLDDFIMVRSDGMPTYQFAVVVDDLALAITHVIRGADHIDNTHCQIALYHALGKEPPRFGHAPRIDGLSKRKGSPSVEYYREALGLLPEGLNNYIARLGWSHGDDEIFTMDELVKAFDICDVNRSNGEFDEEKLKWVNEQQLRIVPIEEIADHTIPRFEKAGVHVEKGEWLYKLLEMMRKRAHNLNEIVSDSLFIWHCFAHSRTRSTPFRNGAKRQSKRPSPKSQATAASRWAKSPSRPVPPSSASHSRPASMKSSGSSAKTKPFGDSRKLPIRPLAPNTPSCASGCSSGYAARAECLFPCHTARQIF